jgi:protein-disulfide isomerase
MAKPSFLAHCAGLLIASSMLAMVAPGNLAAADGVEKAEIEKIVREYLLANPEIMVEMQKALEEKREAEQTAQQAKTLADMKEIIFNSPNQIVIGAKDAPVTIVEFFDYNCGYCQRAMSDMTKIVEAEKDVRFILKEFPVLGEPSLEAHRVTLAFNRLMPQKAAELHLKLLGAEGRKNGEVAMAMALEMGADEAALKAEMEKPEILAAIKEVYAMADGLGINGTPSYIVGDEVVFGAVGLDQLNTRVANMRQCGKTVC